MLHTGDPKVYWWPGMILSPFLSSCLYREVTTQPCAVVKQTGHALFHGDGPWLTLFPFPFPGVADSRERAHAVPDGAGGGVGRTFQASRHRGLAPDGAQRAAQRRYGSTGISPAHCACTPGVLEKSLLTPFPAFPAALGLVNHKTNGNGNSGTRGSQPPPWLGLSLSSVYRDEDQEVVWRHELQY